MLIACLTLANYHPCTSPCSTASRSYHGNTYNSCRRHIGSKAVILVNARLNLYHESNQQQTYEGTHHLMQYKNAISSPTGFPLRSAPAKNQVLDWCTHAHTDSSTVVQKLFCSLKVSQRMTCTTHAEFCIFYTLISKSKVNDLVARAGFRTHQDIRVRVQKVKVGVPHYSECFCSVISLLKNENKTNNMQTNKQITVTVKYRGPWNPLV